MYKLAGLDAGFLYSETPRAPQHIASVQVLELPDGVNPTDFIADFKQLLVSRAHLVPYFTNKLQWVPFQLDHPEWVGDEAFDIDNHVLHAGGRTRRGRAESKAEIARTGTPPPGPAQAVVGNLGAHRAGRGRIAYYNRVHHACLDGVSGQAAIEAIMDTTPEPRAVQPPPPEHTVRRRPGSLEMLAGAFQNLAGFQLRQASRALEHVETARRLWQRAVDPAKGLGAVTESAPPTRFNRAVERQRSYATGELPLGDLRSISKATGTSLNDVFLAVCAGGLRSYLERRGELPGKSMIAGCPVSLRKPGDTASNNQVTMMMVSLASNEADPVKRLLQIGRSAIQGKGFVADVAGSYDADVALPGLPGLLSSAMQMLESANLVDVDTPRLPCNIVVSNVPGPRQQLYSLGAKVLTHYPVSIPAHSQGANITVQSYQGQMFFGITACRRALPDPDVLRDDMLAAFVALQERVLKTPAVLTPRQRAIDDNLPPLGVPAPQHVRQSEAA
ncbi:MAG: wax ester/triacylglycerol synthase family O-acyltransferase [Gammaproteobacteria bacterium]|nr:wax ester/triacylglycerol synthase family O-acyltransferase [Gammaproteobacteria bacterium]